MVQGERGGDMKNMQIPESMFVDVVRLISALDDYELDESTDSIKKRLEIAINTKIEAMERRNTYTTYKTADTDAEREAARQKYLELAGVHPDWRWSAETKNNTTL